MFVEFTDKQSQLPVAFNKNKIISVCKNGNHCTINAFTHSFGNSYVVEESYEKVLEKLRGY